MMVAVTGETEATAAMVDRTPIMILRACYACGGHQNS
jgi:hypothetical protein